LVIVITLNVVTLWQQRNRTFTRVALGSRHQLAAITINKTGYVFRRVVNP